MGREVGGGFRMGNASTPMVDSYQCMAKPIQYCKVINLQLNILKKKSEIAKKNIVFSKVIQLCIYLFFFRFFSHLRYY